MTTNSSQMAQCPTCAAGVAEAAAWREAFEDWLCTPSKTKAKGDALLRLVKLNAAPSPAVEELERRLAEADALENSLRLKQQVYETVWKERERFRKQAEALAALVPEAELLRCLAVYASLRPLGGDVQKEALALAARIEDARREQAQEEGGGD